MVFRFRQNCVLALKISGFAMQLIRPIPSVVFHLHHASLSVDD